MTKLTIVVPILNQYRLFVESLNMMVRNLESPDVEFIIIDNDSDEGGQRIKDALNSIGIDWKEARKLQELKVISNNHNIGCYPIYEQAFKIAKGQIIAYFHSDFFIYEKGWDRRVIAEFEKDPKLGLIGFIGSNEIDNWSGRGMGTMSNFQGRQVKDWKGSKAEIHGKRIGDLQPGAVVDGCSMIFRRQCLFQIGFRENFPLHHFYDRLMSCQVLEKGFKVGVLGIECDHISGQTVSAEKKHHNVSEEWAKKHLGIEKPQDWAEKNKDWVNNSTGPAYQKVPKSWDEVIYREAERILLKEYKYEKKFIPLRV